MKMIDFFLQIYSFFLIPPTLEAGFVKIKVEKSTVSGKASTIFAKIVNLFRWGS
jgi:hypothetical protein